MRKVVWFPAAVVVALAVGYAIGHSRHPGTGTPSVGPSPQNLHLTLHNQPISCSGQAALCYRLTVVSHSKSVLGPDAACSYFPFDQHGRAIPGLVTVSIGNLAPGQSTTQSVRIGAPGQTITAQIKCSATGAPSPPPVTPSGFATPPTPQG